MIYFLRLFLKRKSILVNIIKNKNNPLGVTHAVHERATGGD